MLKRLLGSLRVRIAYALAYSLKEVRQRGFFTVGFWPPLPQLIEVPALTGARTQANIHELAMRQLPGPRPAPRAVLDIGCGAGGGLLYAHAAFPQAALVGVDVARPALKAAWERVSKLPRIELREAPGDRTRLPPHRFDLIVSIGAVNAIGPSELLTECARVLAPGGVVSIVASFRLKPEEVQVLFHAAAWQAGLVLRQVYDISEGTKAALAQDRPVLERLVNAVPFPFRRAAREMAALPGSRSAEAIQAGQLRSYAILVDSPAAPWQAPRLAA